MVYIPLTDFVLFGWLIDKQEKITVCLGCALGVHSLNTDSAEPRHL